MTCTVEFGCAGFGLKLIVGVPVHTGGIVVASVVVDVIEVVTVVVVVIILDIRVYARTPLTLVAPKVDGARRYPLAGVTPAWMDPPFIFVWYRTLPLGIERAYISPWESPSTTAPGTTKA